MFEASKVTRNTTCYRVPCSPHAQALIAGADHTITPPSTSFTPHHPFSHYSPTAFGGPSAYRSENTHWSRYSDRHSIFIPYFFQPHINSAAAKIFGGCSVSRSNDCNFLALLVFNPAEQNAFVTYYGGRKFGYVGYWKLTRNTCALWTFDDAVS